MSFPVLCSIGGPQFPGTDAWPEVDAVLIEARLEGFASHTRRHFAGVQETHDFFTRQALHAALCDIWQPRFKPGVYHPDLVPYGASPFVAAAPRTHTLAYGSPEGWQSDSQARTRLTVGTMQVLSPGDTLRAALWGDPAHFPDLFVGRAFDIGKGRVPVRVTRLTHERVRITTTQRTSDSLPAQVDAGDYNALVVLREMAGIVRVRTPRYVIFEPALDEMVPRFVIGGVTVPVFDVPAASLDEAAHPTDPDGPLFPGL